MLHLISCRIFLFLVTNAVAGSIGKGKIAFMFMTRGNLPLEEVWREFFTDPRTDPSEYSIYVHPTMRGRHKQKGSLGAGSFFAGKEVCAVLEAKM